MPNVTTLQANFSKGQLSPRLYARTDYADYYKGARTLRNCVTIPQGGAKKRFGTNFVADLTGTGVTDTTHYNLAVLEDAQDELFVIVFYASSINIYRGDTGALLTTIASPYSAAQNSQLKWAQNDSVLVVTHPSHAPRLLERTGPTTFSFNAAVFKFKPTHDFNGGYDTFTFTLGAKTGTGITLQCSSAIFTSGFIGGIYTDGIGMMRLTGFNSTTEMVGYITVDFDDTSIRGDLSYLAEPVYSTARGWPASVTFFQNRLVFGGSTSLPDSVYFSKSNDYFNFNDSEDFDDSSFGFFVKSTRRTEVQNVLGTTSLLVFTTGGIFSTSNSLGEATTPSTAVNEQTKTGVGNVPPISNDNRVFLVDKGGQIIKAMDFDFTRQTYQSLNVSVTTNVIDNPQFAAVYDSPTEDDGNFILFVNEDGTLAILTALAEQNIQGWSLNDTDGEFFNIADAGTAVWFLIKRSINGGDKFYLEQLDFNSYTDSTINYSGVSTNTITGLSTLEGKSVWVKSEIGEDGSGLFLGSHTVTSGQIVLPTENASTTFQVGLPFSPEIVPMPINVDTRTGPTLYLPKHIQAFYADYLDTLGLIVDGIQVPDTNFNTFVFGQPNPLRSGFFRFIPMEGWDPFGVITLTQASPFPFLIRGISMDIDVDQPSGVI